MKTLRRRAALASVIAIASVLGLSSPALAHATLTIGSPRPGLTLESNAHQVTVQVNADDRTTVQAVKLVIEQLEPTKRTIAVPGGSTQGGRTTFNVSLPFNGKYRVSASANWTHSTLLGVSEHSHTATDGPFDFLVGAPPASPADVKAVVNAETREVTLTWKANPEPDILFYLVQRDTGPGTEAKVLGRATEPTFVDATTAAAGGEYRYQVVAVRHGTKAGEGINSDPSSLSAESIAKVPNPPPPPTTAPPAGSGTTVVAGTPTTAASGTASSVPSSSPGALATSGKVDLSGFTTIQNQTRRSDPRPAPEVDTGFQGTLPFDIPEGEQQEEAEEGGELGEIAADSPLLRELGSEDDGTERQRSLAFLAAGLLATVLLMHVLWVKSEVEKVPLEAVAPEGPQPVTSGFRPPGSPAKVPPMAKPPKAPTARLRADGGSRSGQRGSKVGSGV